MHPTLGSASARASSHVAGVVAARCPSGRYSAPACAHRACCRATPPRSTVTLTIVPGHVHAEGCGREGEIVAVMEAEALEEGESVLDDEPVPEGESVAVMDAVALAEGDAVRGVELAGSEGVGEGVTTLPTIGRRSSRPF